MADTGLTAPKTPKRKFGPEFQSTREQPLSGRAVDTKEKSVWQAVGNLWPYMWPSGRPDLKARVFWAFLVLVVAKVVTVLVPYFYK